MRPAGLCPRAPLFQSHHRYWNKAPRVGRGAKKRRENNMDFAMNRRNFDNTEIFNKLAQLTQVD